MITVQIESAIGTITLNQEAKRNALSERLVNEVAAAFTEFSHQKVRCAVLRAAPGAKVWSSGHDVSELPEAGQDPLGWRDPLRQLIRELENFAAPVIAMIEGSVWGVPVRRSLPATSSSPAQKRLLRQHPRDMVSPTTYRVFSPF